MINISTTIPHAISPRQPHLLEIHGALIHRRMNVAMVANCMLSSAKLRTFLPNVLSNDSGNTSLVSSLIYVLNL